MFTSLDCRLEVTQHHVNSAYSLLDVLSFNCAGCELSDECSVTDIGDSICSAGSGMKCKCQYPHLTSSDNTCIDGMVYSSGLHNIIVTGTCTIQRLCVIDST